MIIVKVPATTSNLGVGFDTLGMALNIYNVFAFTESKENQLSGFDEENTKDNLVLNTYISFCIDMGLKEEDIQKVHIDVVENSIPIARGLGSSATCIIAGIIAANELNKLNKTLLECAAYASKLEGHPDNVFSAMKGGLNATFHHQGEYINESLKVSKNLYFTLLIPGTTGKTEVLRSILPDQVLLSDAVYNLSRIIQMPTAFEKGDFALLQKVLRDTLHQQYRAPYIPKYKEVEKIAKDHNIISLISGSGPTLFLISEKAVTNEFDQLKDTFTIVNVSLASGTSWESVL